MRPEEKIKNLFINNKKTLSAAESCTGGLFSSRITDIPGSSEFFKLGLITYSNEAKIQLLKIPPQILAQHGAVSEEVAILMARAVRGLQKTDFGIGITGIAGPAGATFKKPVGLTYIAISTEYKNSCAKCLFKGNRIQIKKRAVNEAFKLLLNFSN